MKKIFLSAVLAGILTLSGTAAFAAAEQIIINGQTAEIPADMGSIREQNDRTFVPVRFVSQYLDCTVSYNPGQESATITDKAGVSYLMMRNSPYLYVLPNSGTAARYKMDTETFVDDSEGRMYVPIRYFAEALGYTVGWDDATQTATLTLAQ